MVGDVRRQGRARGPCPRGRGAFLEGGDQVSVGTRGAGEKNFGSGFWSGLQSDVPR